MERCYKVSCQRYKRYGNRGITVCPEWHDPHTFIQDMAPGYKKGLQIDRINNNGDYSKINCKWSTRIEQALNKSNTVAITFNNETHTIRQWSIITGISYGTLVERIRILHWPIHKALNHPVRKGNYKKRLNNNQ